MSLPFLLPFRYLMYSEDVDGELVYPPGLKEKLLSQGLIPTELSDGELNFYLLRIIRNATDV